MTLKWHDLAPFGWQYGWQWGEYPSVMSVVNVLLSLTAIVISIISYRRVSSMKALDLRVEIQKLQVAIEQDIQALPALLESANQSRVNVYAAIGLGSSGAMENWKHQRTADQAEFGKLRAEFSGPLGADLEAELVRVYALQQRVQRLIERCRITLAEDDKERDHIRAARGVARP